MKNLIVLLSLTLVIFLAGCIGQPAKAAVGEGVIIKSFGPDVPEIYAGDSVVVTLVVENVGEEDARNVNATLAGLGLDWEWEKTPKNVAEILERSQPTEGLPGEVAVVQWDVTSPEEPKIPDYPLKVKVRYDYGTTMIGSLKVYNSDYLKSLPVEEAQKIRKTSGIESFSTSIAPVSIKLTGAARPFIITKDGQEGRVSFQISHIGSGTPYMFKPGDFKIQINKAKVNTTDCTANWKKPGEDKLIVKIPSRGPKSLTCNFTLPSKGEVPTFTTIPVEMEIMYSYCIHEESAIRVLK